MANRIRSHAYLKAAWRRYEALNDIAARWESKNAELERVGGVRHEVSGRFP